MDSEANPSTAEAPAAPEGSTSEPPPLPYSLRDRKKSIAFFWFLFILDCTAQPLGLYFGLWYGTDLSHNLGTFIAEWPDFERYCSRLIWSLISLHHRHHFIRRYLGIRVLLSPL